MKPDRKHVDNVSLILPPLYMSLSLPLPSTSRCSYTLPYTYLLPHFHFYILPPPVKFFCHSKPRYSNLNYSSNLIYGPSTAPSPSSHYPQQTD